MGVGCPHTGCSSRPGTMDTIEHSLAMNTLRTEEMTTRAQIPDTQKHVRLGPPRVMTGRERRWIDPNKGSIKRLETQHGYRLRPRFFYPRLGRVWNPYSWLLEKTFSVSQRRRFHPQTGPTTPARCVCCFISDIHTGIFLKPQTLSEILLALMELGPDLVAIGGDIVSGQASEVVPYLDALAPLSGAPLGAWSCFGNHDYFDGNPEGIQRALDSIGIRTLKNESVSLPHRNGGFVLGGIDDLILGQPDWKSRGFPSTVRRTCC